MQCAGMDCKMTEIVHLDSIIPILTTTALTHSWLIAIWTIISVKSLEEQGCLLSTRTRETVNPISCVLTQKQFHSTVNQDFTLMREKIGALTLKLFNAK